jgi:hypothetical protein
VADGTRRQRGDILKRLGTGETWTVETVGKSYFEVRPYLGAPDDMRHPFTGELLRAIPTDDSAFFEPSRVGVVTEFRFGRDASPSFSWSGYPRG